MIQQATLGVRLLSLLLLLLGTWQGVANLLSGIRDFDPTYWGYFFQIQLLRPALAVALGLLLYSMSRPLGRLLARQLVAEPKIRHPDKQ